MDAREIALRELQELYADLNKLSPFNEDNQTEIMELQAEIAVLENDIEEGMVPFV